MSIKDRNRTSGKAISKNTPKMATPQKIIYDVDFGTDDYLGLLLFLQAEKLGQVIIMAVICSIGNTDINNSCKNLVRLLELVNRTDIPVYRGAAEAMSPPSIAPKQFFGKDGFGDLKNISQPDLSIIQEENFAVALNRILTENPGEITLVLVASMTNVGLALKVYENFASNVKSVWIMGGNYKGQGNVEVSFAEYNFYVDPQAAHTVFAKIQKPIYILPWETCKQPKISLNWHYNVFGAKKNPAIQLVKEADMSVYGTNLKDEWNSCDTYLVASFLNPRIITKKSVHNVTIELDGTYTFGEMITDLDNMEDFKNNATVIESINTMAYKGMLMKL